MTATMLPDEVCELLRLPMRTVSRLARRGDLPCYILPDGTLRFDADELRAWLDSLKNPSIGREAVK